MEQEYNRTFQVGPGCHVDIRNVRGTTRIEAWDRPEVQIIAQKRVRGGQADEATVIEIGQEGNEVWARTRLRSGGDWLDWLGSKRPAAVDYKVKVPHQCQVSTSMVSGETTVVGVHDTLKLSTVSGDATIEDIAGKISLNSVSGDIAASALRGDVAVNTVSGDVMIQASDLSALRGNTVSGDIRAETPLADDGHYAFSSVSGDLRLTVPPETRCTAKLSTLSGDLRVTLPHEVVEDHRTTKVYKINGGGVACGLNSVSGDMRIMAKEAAREEPAKVTEEAIPATAERPASPAFSKRMEILQAIESGELTVQEGLARLQDLPFDE